jgi:hypothetical protein
VPRPERIAVLDGAGTLACERPLEIPTRFTLDLVQALSEDHEDWASIEAFREVLALGPQPRGGVEPSLVLEAHARACAGMSGAEYTALVEGWLSTVRHERFERPRLELVYQPMIELMLLLRARGFQVWFSSSGDQDFLRCITQDFYDVPPSHVIGSTSRKHLETREGGVVLVRGREPERLNIGPGKVASLAERLGRVPILAAGNSDEDLEMLRWIDDGIGPALLLVVRHDDGEREYVYDEGSERLRRAGDVNGWQIVSMKRDFATVFPQSP